MDQIAKLKLAHQVALESFRESITPSGRLCPFELRQLKSYEAALSRAGVGVTYGDDGDVTYAHDGDVIV
jgi:hypothetical protein